MTIIVNNRGILREDATPYITTVIARLQPTVHHQKPQAQEAPPEKPHAATPKFDNIPPPLRKGKRLLLGKSELDKDGRWKKPPYQTSGLPASPTNPDHCDTFEEVRRIYARGGYDYIGRMFIRADGICGIDIDDCRTPETGEISEAALAIVYRMNSYTEVSPSGKGLHIFVLMDAVSVQANIPKTHFMNTTVETYSGEHYVTLTGDTLEGYTVVEERTVEAIKLHKEIQDTRNTLKDERQKDGEQKVFAQSTTIDVLEPDMSNDELDRLLRSIKKIDATHIIPKGELYAARASGNSRYDGDNNSDRDFQLCLTLAWGCRRNPEWMDSMFRQYGPMRKKWDEVHYSYGETYGAHTIEKAAKGCIAWRTVSDDGEDGDEGTQVGDNNKKGSSEEQAEETRRSRYQRVKLSELYKRPIPKYVLDDFLYESESSILLAESGTGKSFLALDWGASMAMGMSWFGHKTEKRKVIYIAAEGARPFLRRIDAWCIHHRVDRTQLEANFSFVEVDVPLLSKNRVEVNAFIEQMKKELTEEGGDPVGLIVLDTLSRCTAGADENNNGMMALAINEAERIRDEVGAAHVLIVHHISDKEGANGHGRGASSVFGSISASFALKKKGDLLELVIPKSKDHDESMKVYMRRHVINTSLWDEQKLQYITSCVMIPANAPDEANRAIILTGAQRSLFGLIPDVGITPSEWRKLAGVPDTMPKPTFESARQQLEKAGLVKKIEEKWIKVVRGVEYEQV